MWRELTVDKCVVYHGDKFMLPEVLRERLLEMMHEGHGGMSA